jgi:hypothetical protein
MARERIPSTKSYAIVTMLNSQTSIQNKQARAQGAAGLHACRAVMGCAVFAQMRAKMRETGVPFHLERANK